MIFFKKFHVFSAFQHQNYSTLLHQTPKAFQHQISRVNSAIFYLLLCLFTLPFHGKSQNNLQGSSGPITVIANPGEQASTSIRVNWHTPLNSGPTSIEYTKVSDKKWKKSTKRNADQEIVAVFDSIYSKSKDGKDIYERVKFIRNTIELKNLEPNTRYQYTLSNDPNQEVRTFRTAPKSSSWSLGVVSDFHVYAPLPKRQEAAMQMIAQLEKQHKKPLNGMLHVGDISAWGGSYSFWPVLYDEAPFRNYMWAGVNGNHDNMTRQNGQNNAFFKNVNNNPPNGYPGEEGVVYHFTYGDALFIMLNNESMRSDEGLAQAQNWARKVISENKARYIIVVSHYQWFMGNDGRISQYNRWKTLFDECGVDLALSANNHIYVRTNALFADKETDGRTGTVYVQTPSADNERGQALSDWVHNHDLIKFRWSEGPQTMGGLILSATKKQLTVKLYDRYGKQLDEVKVRAKR